MYNGFNISTSLRALSKMSLEHVEVRDLLEAIITKTLETNNINKQNDNNNNNNNNKYSSNKLSLKEFSNSLYSMQSMNSDSETVRHLLSVLMDKTESYQDIENASTTTVRSTAEATPITAIIVEASSHSLEENYVLLRASCDDLLSSLILSLHQYIVGPSDLNRLLFCSSPQSAAGVVLCVDPSARSALADALYHIHDNISNRYDFIYTFSLGPVNQPVNQPVERTIKKSREAARSARLVRQKLEVLLDLADRINTSSQSTNASANNDLKCGTDEPVDDARSTYPTSTLTATGTLTEVTCAQGEAHVLIFVSNVKQLIIAQVCCVRCTFRLIYFITLYKHLYYTYN
jgi:hypothetical protein